VATFYDMLETSPAGRHSVYVCTNISCSLRGADALLAAIREGTVRDKVTALKNKGIGPAGWTPHWFRHSHASALLLAGTPEWVVSRRLGHAHVQTTIDLYGWVREDEALQAAANWKSYASSWQVPDGR